MRATKAGKRGRRDRVRGAEKAGAALVVALGLVFIACGENPMAPTETVPSKDRTVFVTSAIFTGAIGGVSAANRACTDLAIAAGLPGTYRAWLSDIKGLAPSLTFTRPEAPFVMTSGVRVADHWADLVDGTLNNPIVIDERGAQADSVPMVWTGTDPHGRPVASDAMCHGWMSASGDAHGQVGGFDEIGNGWSALQTNECDQPGRLYCFQQ